MFIVGSTGQINIQFHDLSPVEAARLVGSIVGQMYDLTKQNKASIDICSTYLPLSADGRNNEV